MYPYYSMYQYFIYFQCQIVCHCVDRQLFIHSSLGRHLGSFHLALVNNASGSPHGSFHASVPYLLTIPENEIAGSHGHSLQPFEKLPDSLSKAAVRSTFLPPAYEGFSFSHPCRHLLLSVTCYSHPTGCEAVSHCDFNSRFFNDVEHLFMCFSITCVSSLEKCLLKSFGPFKINILFL